MNLTPFATPRVERAAPAIADSVFWFGGRPLRVVRALGDDPAAPVICEELSGDVSLPGQYALWSLDAVRKQFAANRLSREAR